MILRATLNNISHEKGLFRKGTRLIGRVILYANFIERGFLGNAPH
jgi:hypothetical protein